MVRKRFRIPRTKGLTVDLLVGRGMENPRIQELHEAFKKLDEQDQQVIEGCIQCLVAHPKFSGVNFGPAAALELIGAIGERLAWKGRGHGIKECS